MLAFDFERAFGFTPTPAQQQVSTALNKVSLPTLAVIEAPMGSGKTEAALAVYAHWAKTARHSGLYVAMPTTATSNQMHTRVTDFLSKQFGMDIEPLLVHGQALLRDAPAENEAVEEADKEGDQSAAQAWFLPRKKSLLAPFGVGTVDQTLMSVLQTKHFFVRLLGLHHKVVIFDEVHAYDAYMSELFERLLIWLRQIGASVIVLSATLPNKTRQRLISAYAGNASLLPAAHYPRLTFAATDGKVDALELASSDEKILSFEWIDREEETIITRLRDELREGGCAVVICNTIARAQKIYEALMEERFCDDDHLILFHARFPFAWREELERKVLDQFGPGEDKTKPNPKRPAKAVVIATQVVEQSLDLDFDVMISDHAPVDLLLQRAGRLQRHKVNAAARKQPYRLLIAAPDVDNEMPTFERGDKFVYDEYVLLRSWVVLNQLAVQEIILPTGLPTLIEQVYGDAEPTDQPELLAALTKAKEGMAKDELGMKVKARKRLVAKPDYEDLLWGDNAGLEEDDPTVHETFQALTRADRPGISVVCLHRVADKLCLEPDDPSTVFDPAVKLDKAMARELARHAASVRHFDPTVERALLEPSDAQSKNILAKWRRVAALRYHRVAIFENGVCRLVGTNYVLRLNKRNQLGLQIVKEAS
jgi:CRISPR-associated endonuclease/helicase Cas3